MLFGFLADFAGLSRGQRCRPHDDKESIPFAFGEKAATQRRFVICGS